MRIFKTSFAILAGLIAAATMGWAEAPAVRTVPADAGNPLVPHLVLAHRATTLKASTNVSGPEVEATWDFGDGSTPRVLTVTNPHDVSVRHTYRGAVGARFTATLTIVDRRTAESARSTYPVEIREPGLAVEAGIAIEEGLWYLHKTMNRSGNDGGDWRGNCGAACDADGLVSAANLIAFQRVGFRDSASDANPYTDTTRRALRTLLERGGDEALRTADWVEALATVNDPARVAETGPAGIRGETLGQIVAQFRKEDGVTTARAASIAPLSMAGARELIDLQTAEGYWKAEGSEPAFATARAIRALAETFRAAGASTIFNISSQVSVTTSGFLFSRVTRTFNGTMTVTNTSGTPIPGPINVVLTNLTPGVTLANANGTYNGNPYRTAVGGTPLNPGQSVAIPLSFNNPANALITSVPVTYSGTFPPMPVTIGCPATTGINGTPYSSALVGEGGIQTYTYSVTGNLPNGLFLNPATGAIAGTPTVNGTFPFSGTLNDGSGLPSGTATQNCSITISPAVQPLTLSCPATTGQVGVPYNSSLVAGGGVTSYSYSIFSGSLPPPLSLNQFTGAIDGTPNAAGSYPFVAMVTDSASPTPSTTTANCNINVSPAATVAITVNTVPAGLTIVVDGNTLTAPQVFNWVPGSNHTISTTTPQGSGGTRYVFNNWSDGGAISHTVTAPASATTFTASFDTEYQLTTAASPANGGTVTPASGSFFPANSVQNVSATTNSGFVFGNWTGPVANASSAATTVTMTGPVSVTANFTGQVGVTVTTVPAGLTIIVDGNTLTAPQVFNWTPGSQHTIATTSPQGSGGTRYVFNNWSDGGAISHTVTAPASATTFTASFDTEYQLTTAASPANGGTVAPASGGFFPANSVQNVSATANSGFSFTNWTGPVANANSAASTVTMTGPVSVTANFTAQVGVTVTTVPAGLTIIVDGNTLTAPQVFNWTPGSQHTIATTTPQGSGGTRYVFSTWSDGGAISHVVTVPGSPITYTASFNTEYELTLAPSPANGGNLTPASGSFFPANSVQNVTATPTSGFAFNGWTGPVAAALSATTTVTMTGPVALTANFVPALQLACQPTTQGNVGTPFSSALAASGGTAAYTYSLQSGTLPPPLTIAPATGVISGTPNAKGNYNFVAQVQDATAPIQQTATASCSILIPNRLPTANGTTATTNEDVAVQIPLTGTDPDGDALTFSLVTPPSKGGVTGFGAGTCSGVPSNCTRNVTYTPSANLNGADSFTFLVNDGEGNSTAVTVSITINAVNDAPVLTAKNFNVQAGMRIVLGAGTMVAGTTDPGDPENASPAFTLTAFTPSSGTIQSFAGDGSFTYDPPPGVTGNVPFTYTVCDNGVGAPASSCTGGSGTFVITGPVIWFVNLAAGGGGNGNLATPFNSLASATTAMGANTNQRIFIMSSGSTTSGSNVTLPADGWLVGQGVTGASFDAVMGITPPVSTIARPAINTTHPVVQGTVNMNGNNVNVRGLRIQPPSGSVGLQATLTGPFTGQVVGDMPNITATGARAVNLNNVSGTYNITAVNASGSYDIGINLNNVNPSAGSFTVSGNGGSCSNASASCTGGTITGATDTGVKLNNTRGVSLTRMRVANTGNFGLNGTNVTNMDLSTCLFNGTHGNAQHEGALYVTNLLGSATITGCEILGGANDTVRITNNTGVLNRLTISNSIIRDNQAGSNHGLRFASDVASGAGLGLVMNLTVQNSTFTNNQQNHIDTGVNGLAQMDVQLLSNTFQRTTTVQGGAVNLTVANQADLTFDVNGNNSNGSLLSAFNFFMSNTTTTAASMVGRFRNNIIGTTGVANSGSVQGDGVAFTATGLGALTASVTGNQIRRFANMGIIFTAGDTSPVVNATVTGNTVKEGDTVNALNGIHFNMGTTAAGAVSACADIGGAGALANDVAGSVPGGTGEIRVRQRNSSTFRLPGLTGTAVDFLTARNTIGAGGVTTQGSFAGGAGCATVP